jgi:hypothetical protein
MSHDLRRRSRRFASAVCSGALCALAVGGAAASAQGPPGGFGGPSSEDRKIVEKFDADKNGRLDAKERAEARKFLKENPEPEVRGGGFRGPDQGGPPSPRGNGPPRPTGGGRGRPMPNEELPAAERPPTLRGIKPADAKVVDASHDLYDPTVLRTIFLDFPNEDWFEELEAFYRTDVEVPATMTVDGKTYEEIGVAFRGNSSYRMVRGRKKSFALKVDFARDKQTLLGYDSLDLLNANDDPSFVREILYTSFARMFGAAPQANLVRLVVNGENFGVYVNVQQFDKTFLARNFGTKKGTRWKVPANFAGDSALVYKGDDVEAYRKLYRIKGESKGDDAAWKALIDLCRALKETSAVAAPEVLPKKLDVFGALWFLALDNVFMDGDGYHGRGSDYSLYLDPKGVFHVLSRDDNETFGLGGGPGRPGGPGGPGGFRRRGPEERAPEGPPPGPPEGFPEGPPPRGPVEEGPIEGEAPASRGVRVPQFLDPLAKAEDPMRPLASKLLSVPRWRARYLAYVRALRDELLTREAIERRARPIHALIDEEVKRDDKALYGYAAFKASLDAGSDAPRGRAPALLTFVESRRASLDASPALKDPAPKIVDVSHALVTNGRENVLLVWARAGAGSGIDRMSLWVRRGERGPFVLVPMLDNGGQGDGAPGDGYFGAAAPSTGKLAVDAFYIEASTKDFGATSFHPPLAEGAPIVVGKN